MTVQAVFMNAVGQVRALRYVWAEDGSVFFALDCHLGLGKSVLTFGELLTQLGDLCFWQLHHPVMIGHVTAVVDVLTIYHAFEHAESHRNTLMLVSTPPDEYFESLAA